jgi:hypothetical protein
VAVDTKTVNVVTVNMITTVVDVAEEDATTTATKTI